MELGTRTSFESVISDVFFLVVSSCWQLIQMKPHLRPFTKFHWLGLKQNWIITMQYIWWFNFVMRKDRMNILSCLGPVSGTSLWNQMVLTLVDLPWVSSLVVTNMSLILSGVCLFAFPFCPDFTSFVVVALFLGLFVSAFISLTSIGNDTKYKNLNDHQNLI